MSLSTHVPADVEPLGMVDLLDDCREVSGVLGLPSSWVPLPRQERPETDPLVIDLDTVSALEGWGAYGS